VLLIGFAMPGLCLAQVAKRVTFPDPSFVETNGIKIAVYEQGDGFPVVFCHGFPELAYSWRHQLPALAEAGYHAIAPDQRGYGRTDRPDEIEAYSLEHLCNDMVGLLDAKNIEKAVFCGHDWGGLVVWMMPILHPDRVAGVIGVNTPLTPRPPIPPIQILRLMRGKDNYVAAFQQPGVADRILARDVRKTFEMLMRRGMFDAEEFAKLPTDAPKRKFQLLKMLEDPDSAANPPGQRLLGDNEMDYFVRTFEETGFTGGINWYRNIDRNWEQTRELKFRIDVPCLYVGAEDDVILPPSSALMMAGMVSNLKTHTIKDCGHWTQQEKPDEFNRVVIDWLEETFSKRRE
jgi:pimeloyl-ACP methyl ester carboxylesterase